MSALQRESLIQRSPRGKRVQELLQHIDEKHAEPCVTDFAVTVVAKLNTCLASAQKYKLPSLSQGSMWSSFHKVRNSDELKQIWSSFIGKIKAPESCQVECQLALQLLVDRIIKKMLKNKADAKSVNEGEPVPPLTIREQSAIRYMAGYVAFKLLKRYGKPSTHPQIQLKRRHFVHVLKGMKAANQPDTMSESLSDYTSLWSELIDRGGLYHINDKVCTVLTTLLCMLIYIVSSDIGCSVNTGSGDGRSAPPQCQNHADIRGRH